MQMAYRGGLVLGYVNRAKAILSSAQDRPLVVGTLTTVALCTLAFIVYWPILDDYFALDDFIWLQAASNPDISDLFRDAFVSTRVTSFDFPTPFWRPAIDIYFFVMWRSFGLDPLPYHVASVAFHAANGQLIAVLVWQLTTKRLASLLAGALFLTLPTYDFAVSWISSVTEVSAVLFYLLTMVLYVAYLKNTKNKAWLYALALVSMLLGLFSKESAITLPAVLAGLALAVQPPGSVRQLAERAAELAPFAALGVAYFVFRYLDQYSGASEIGLYRFDTHAIGHFWDYMQWMALPVPDTRAAWIGDARPFAAALLLVIGAGALILRPRTLGFAFAWMLVALVPYLFFLAEPALRYTYLPAAPMAVFVGLSAASIHTLLRARFSTMVAATFVGIVVLVVGVFLALEARDHQAFIGHQARLYRAMMEEGSELCGSLPRASRIFIVDSPVFDFSGVNSRMAFNLQYDDVHVDRVRDLQDLPDVASLTGEKCVVQFDRATGRYRRVTDF